MAFDRFKKTIGQMLDTRSSDRIRQETYQDENMQNLADMQERQQKKKQKKAQAGGEYESGLDARSKALSDLGIARQATSK